MTLLENSDFENFSSDDDDEWTPTLSATVPDELESNEEDSVDEEESFGPVGEEHGASTSGQLQTRRLLFKEKTFDGKDLPTPKDEMQVCILE